jgi:hypothetical protein
MSNVKSGVSILLAIDLRCNRKLEAYATKSATLKFIFDKALAQDHRTKSLTCGSSGRKPSFVTPTF